MELWDLSLSRPPYVPHPPYKGLSPLASSTPSKGWENGDEKRDSWEKKRSLFCRMPHVCMWIGMLINLIIFFFTFLSFLFGVESSGPCSCSHVYNNIKAISESLHVICSVSIYRWSDRYFFQCMFEFLFFFWRYCWEKIWQFPFHRVFILGISGSLHVKFQVLN